MSQKFKFNILTGENCKEKYANIVSKDPFTFYLLQCGIGYLGEKKLFDASLIDETSSYTIGKFFRKVEPKVIAQEDLDNPQINKPEGTAIGDSGIVFTADNNETDDGNEVFYFVPIKAGVDVTGKFFRDVDSYTITDTDLTDGNFSYPEGTVAGDTGLLFTADNNDTTDGDEKKFFIPIKIAPPDTTDTIGQDTPGTKIPTVAAMIAYVTEVMQDKVTFEIDSVPGVNETGVGSSMQIYSTEETCIGTWIDGKPLYRKVFTETKDTGDGAYTILSQEETAKIFVTSIHGMFMDDNLAYPLPHMAVTATNTEITKLNGMAYLSVSYNRSGIQIYGNGSNLQDRYPNIIVIVEYTKNNE